MIVHLIGGVSLAIWLYLLLGRGGFWRGAERDDNLLPGQADAAAIGAWPDVVAVVPARDEAEVIARSVSSLLRQTYPGRFSVVLVDDGSSDGTGEIARAAAEEAHAADCLTVLRGSEPPPGWTGKLWAMQRGFEHVQANATPADFVLFTDADIAYHAPDALQTLVRGALARKTVLTSLMVKLRCDTLPEKVLVPAFIFFFQKLYPFAWVNDPRSAVAAAAGGSMLVRRDALVTSGGLGTIRHAIIDDCALGALLKREGPIWLGLTERVVSLRPYPAFGDIRRMVTRSAYAELRYSPLRLLGAIVGMAVTYLAPPLLAFFADGPARAMGIAAWVIMAVAYWPTLRAYGRSPAWGLVLPLVAATYTGFTVDSAIQHWRGRGGSWKGRFQAHGSAPALAEAAPPAPSSRIAGA